MSNRVLFSVIISLMLVSLTFLPDGFAFSHDHLSDKSSPLRDVVYPRS